ncbi:MAG: hypothetical protein WD604_14510 [Balneolaceae bacterium]
MPELTPTDHRALLAAADGRTIAGMVNQAKSKQDLEEAELLWDIIQHANPFFAREMKKAFYQRVGK